MGSFGVSHCCIEGIGMHALCWGMPRLLGQSRRVMPTMIPLCPAPGVPSHINASALKCMLS